MEVTGCLSCGAIVIAGQEDYHERLHPRIGCHRAHPTMDVACPGGHAWEEQFRSPPAMRRMAGQP